ncbi:MAG: glycosyltransferase family 39 protein [Solirubrobacteraceae bacterium]
MRARLRSLPLPVGLLAVVSVLSLGARVAWLGYPCQSPCTTTADHLLIFDEVYYVNAARVIDGIRPAAGAHYATAPLGDDPNSEHPQLVKLVIAGSIELFGDNPLAWRLGSLIAGSLAILGMWALARAAGAGRWLALGAATLMGADNLLLVAGRIGTLDIYAVAAIVWAIALYVRRRPLSAALVLGIGAACKEVAVYALLVAVLFECFTALGLRPSWRALARSAGRLAVLALGSFAVFMALLEVMGVIAPPYDPGTGKLVPSGALGHLEHMISYAATLTSPNGPQGIASYPWEWLVDYKPIVYLSIAPGSSAPGLVHDHPESMFLGMISPPIMLLALPALGVAAFGVWRTARRRAPAPAPAPATAPAPAPAPAPATRGDDFAPGAAATLGLAWFLATFLPFEALSLFLQRTSYLYYMIIVMPGIYLAVAALVARWRRRRWLVGIWMLAVLAAAVVMYPFMPINW